MVRKLVEPRPLRRGLFSPLALSTIIALALPISGVRCEPLGPDPAALTRPDRQSDPEASRRRELQICAALDLRLVWIIEEQQIYGDAYDPRLAQMMMQMVEARQECNHGNAARAIEMYNVLEPADLARRPLY